LCHLQFVVPRYFEHFRRYPIKFDNRVDESAIGIVITFEPLFQCRDQCGRWLPAALLLVTAALIYNNAIRDARYPKYW
jgi:hypothetical protein